MFSVVGYNSPPAVIWACRGCVLEEEPYYKHFSRVRHGHKPVRTDATTIYSRGRPHTTSAHLRCITAKHYPWSWWVLQPRRGTRGEKRHQDANWSFNLHPWFTFLKCTLDYLIPCWKIITCIYRASRIKILPLTHRRLHGQARLLPHLIFLRTPPPLSWLFSTVC